jgi:hypothetical protein
MNGIPKAAKSDCKAHTSDKRLTGRNAMAVSWISEDLQQPKEIYV